MDKNVILSIFIATYNRKEVVVNKIKELLKIQSDEFNVYVLDDVSSDGTADALRQINDSRLRIDRNNERVGISKDGAMPNWYHLLEMCDGKFALHLNDRDLIDSNGVIELIDFLKHHPTLTGGICDLTGGYRIYESPESSFMAIPYFGSHPTGIVFNMDEYRLLKNRNCLFTKEAAYIHPHDLILGRLAQYGEMFQFKKIWSLAGTDSFAKNKSFLYKQGTADDAWFSPKARTQEFRLFITDIAASSFN